MLAIEIEFLTGRYIATAYNTRQASEWPPHPARLYSALVATHFEAESRAVEERAALEWLETQGAPSICAMPASHRETYTVFVPVNDAGMTNVDEEGAALGAAREGHASAVAGGDPKVIKRASTMVAKAEKRFAAALERNVAVPRSVGNPLAGLRVLPEFRVRQPRTFPSVTPHDPRVTYVWPEAVATHELRNRIDGLLRRLVRLGHSSSFVSARLVENPDAANWQPFPGGETILRTVQAGQLAALERAYSLHGESEPRVTPARFEAYTEHAAKARGAVAQSIFASEWLVLRRIGGPSLPMSATAGVARALRKALMSHTAGEIPEMLSGHRADGVPSKDGHLAIVPLPFVGHAHATGSILGIALLLPRNATAEDRRGVYSAVNAWEGAVRQEDEDTPRLSLALGAAGVLDLERVEWASVPATLRAATWCGPARVWHSATPLALDHNPGDLRSRDQGRLSEAIRAATETIVLACVRVGLPEPVSVEVLPAPPLAAAAKVRRYPPFPEQPGRTRRVLTHARLEFPEPVRGPVLLGAGRFHGLGLFRPKDSGE